MRVGSLFSGIGGLELGLERAGMTTVFHVERDPYASQVLAKHWPHVPRFDDVRTVGAHNLPACDVLCGGFPCQDISTAGLRAGIDGEQSGLWREYARIVREVRPRYVLIENVAALLVRGLERVLGDLAACGYDAEWDCIPAAAVGAPHRRDRIFVVAYPRREFRRDEPECEPGGGGASVAGDDGAEGDVAHAQRLAREPRRAGDADEGARGRDAGRGSVGADGVAHADGRGRGPEGVGGVGRAVGERRDAANVSPAAADASACAREVPNPECDGLEGVFPRGSAARATLRSGGDWWAVEPDVGRVAHGVSARVDRLRCLGNAVVPQVAEVIGRMIMAHARGRA